MNGNVIANYRIVINNHIAMNNTISTYTHIITYKNVGLYNGILPNSSGTRNKICRFFKRIEIIGEFIKISKRIL